jgi:WD40 repeat protein
VLALCFSSDDRFLASGGQDATVRLWQLGHETRERGALHDRTLGEVQALAFAPGEVCLVTGCSSLDGAMWRCRWGESGQECMPIPDAPAFSDALCFSPSGRLLASAVSSQVLVWGVAGPVFRRRAVLKGHEGDVKSLAFAPDGRVLACGEDGAIQFWRIGWLWTAQDRPLVAHPGGVTALAYSPGGELLASGGLDRAVRVWRVRSRAAVAVFEGLAGAVQQLRFAAGGRQLVSAAEGGQVVLWDLDKRRRQREWHLDLPALRTVGLSAGGRWAAAGSEDGAVAVYDLGLAPGGAEAHALAGTVR